MLPPQILRQTTDYFLAHLEKQPKKSFYRYDLAGITEQTKQMMQFTSDLFQLRYAMKANNNPTLLDILNKQGVRIDACSEYEALHAYASWFSPSTIQLSSQQSPENRKALYDLGISCVATSLYQLETFCDAVPGWTVWVRINPWQWSGQFKKINTWWISSSFGIWHAYLEEILTITKKAGVTVNKIHIHIWSWTDIATWSDTFLYCLELMSYFPEVSILNMGGGFKVARMPNEHKTELADIIQQFLLHIQNYSLQSGRKISLEVEPWSYLVANFGYIVTTADDIVDTGPDGYRFVKTTTGMDMLLRPALYNAQHPIYHYSRRQQQRSTQGSHTYSFVGHCCESSDLLTPTSDGEVGKRWFDQPIDRGDLIIIWWCGAYCESMRCAWYNGFA
jgi:diaminopimelate decarboxylase